MTGAYAITYWRNFDEGVVECIQTLGWEGTADFGPYVLSPSCGACTGVVTIDPDSVQDISNPQANPDECDPAILAAAGADLGLHLTSPQAQGGGDSFLQMALIDIPSAQSLGLTLTADGDPTTQEAIDQLAAVGATLTHYGYLSTHPGSFFGENGLGGVAGASGIDEDFHAFWQIFTRDTENTWTPDAGAPSGSFEYGSIWISQGSR